MSSQLEDQWKLLRRKDMSCRLWRHFEAHPILTPAAAMTHRDQTLTRAPLLSDAAETYVSMKGAGRPETFAAGARRSVGYLIEVTTDKPIDAYVRADANALRDLLEGPWVVITEHQAQSVQPARHHELRFQRAWP